MNENEPNAERVVCPERNARCAKLAAKSIRHFANGGEYVQLDPRFGGLAWNFHGEQHYDHIASAVGDIAGIAVERVDMPRRAGTDEIPTYGLKRLEQED